MLHQHHQVSSFIEQAHTERLDRLVHRAAALDERAWDALFRRFDARVRAVARAHRLSPHDAEDVAQATWIGLLTHIGTVREPDRVGAYVHTIARRESLRKIGSRRTEPLPEQERSAPPEEGPEAQLLRAERDGSLDVALDALPPHQRRLMRLLLAEPELGYRDIADRLAMPIGSIGPTRARALERLARDTRLAGVAG
jgi:RNA polymerase sigma factor (sigma-70 family)